MNQPRSTLAILLVTFYLFLFAFLPRVSWYGDMQYWLDWMTLLNEHGLGAIYNHPVEYHPVFMTMLAIFEGFHDNLAEVKSNLEYIKLFPLLFDFGGALLVFGIVKIKWENLFLPFFALFNVGYMYNTLLWGQVDAIHTFFAALSVLCMLKGRVTWGLVALVLALNTKLQGIIFVPVVGIIFLYQVIQQPKKLVSIGWALLAQLIILLPFIFGGSVLGYWELIFSATGIHPRVSLNAFNIWQLIGPGGDLMAVPDDNIFFGNFSYKQIGFTLFFSMSALALFPMLRKAYFYFKNKWELDTSFYSLAFLTGGVIALIFFYFNTQMHERYVHPAILFFFLYAISSKKYGLYILISIAYTLQLESVVKLFKLSNYETLIVHPQFIALLFLFVFIFAITELYRSSWKLTRVLPIQEG